MLIDKEKFATHLRKNAAKLSQRKCATYVRRALEAGGARTVGHPVDANTADRDTLEALPGIGPGKAAAWLEERGRGPFCHPSDLARVKGIGPKTRRQLEDLLFYETSERCGAERARPIDL